MKQERDFHWLALIVWMAPSAFAGHVVFYYLFGLVLLVLAILSEVLHHMRKRIEKLRSLKGMTEADFDEAHG